MSEICANILRTKFKEIRELSEQLDNELLADTIQKLEDALDCAEKSLQDSE